MTNEQQLLIDIARYFVKGEKMETLPAVNYIDIMRLAIEHRSVSLVYHTIADALKEQFPDYYRYCASVYAQISNKRKNIAAHITQISTLLQTNGIRHIFIKGIAQSVVLYGNIEMRDCGDMDLVVYAGDINKTYALLKTTGFTQEGNQTDEAIVLSKYLWDIVLEKENIKLELKTASSAVRGNFDLLFNHTSNVDIDGVTVRTLNPAATAVHICANAHETNDGRGVCKGTRIREYAESLIAFRKFATDEMTEISMGVESAHKVYEVLKSCDDLFGLTETEREFIQRFHIRECGYPLELDGWSSKSWDNNGGLLADPYLPDAKTRLFDQNYAMHGFHQRFKNAVFNKPVYKHSYYLLNPEKAVKNEYRGLEGVGIEAVWDKDFILSFSFDKSVIPMEEIMEMGVSFHWFERDLSSPALWVGMSANICTLSCEKTPIDCKCTGFYRESVFREDLSKLQNYYNENPAKPTVCGIDTQKLYTVQFTIPFELLPVDKITPSLIAEAGVRKNRAICNYGYGNEVQVFSFNLYNGSQDEN